MTVPDRKEMLQQIRANLGFVEALKLRKELGLDLQQNADLRYLYSLSLW